MANKIIGHSAPASVVLISTVTAQAITVPVVLTELAGDLGALGLVRLYYTLKVVALCRCMHLGDELYVRHYESLFMAYADIPNAGS